jgi:hypothetical protein
MQLSSLGRQLLSCTLPFHLCTSSDYQIPRILSHQPSSSSISLIMDLSEKSKQSLAKESVSTRSQPQQSTQAEFSEQVTLPPPIGTHSPARAAREKQSRDIPTTFTIFYGPENYSAVRDMPIERNSHTEGRGDQEGIASQTENSTRDNSMSLNQPAKEAIHIQTPTQSLTSSPAPTSTSGAQTE